MTNIIFDLDGTLVDSMPLLTDLAVELLVDRYGLTVDEARGRYLGTIGMSFPDQLETMFSGHAENVATAELYRQRKKAGYVASEELPNARRVPALLQAGGAVVFIVSSTELDLVQRVVVNLRLPGTVVTCGGRKLDQLEYVASNSSGSLFFIGDTPYDALLADQVGARFLGVTHTVDRDEFLDHVTTTPGLGEAYEALFQKGESYLT